MDKPIRILLVDDDLGDARMIARTIRASGLNAECSGVTDCEAARKLIKARDFDCAIIDYQLPGIDGLEGISLFAEQFPHLTLIMSTGHGDESIATEAMKRGAMDYISKGAITASSIRRVLVNAIEKLLLRRRLSDKTRELESFADVLVHDLRAPSSSIQTFLMYIQEDLREGKMEMVEQYCTFALKASARMDTLISTLYQYTRVDGDVPFGPVALQTVFDNVIENLHNTIIARAAIVTHGNLPQVNGSISLLEQLLQNLIGNAIKYCRRPVPTVHVDATLLDSESADGMWEISFKDNGIGIPEEDRNKIFGAFTRLHGIGEFEGTGLGLATCSKIVARHCGTIRCESEIGDGTTFFVTLPQAQAAVASLPEESSQSTNTHVAEHPSLAPRAA